jgi:SAM-dependent methyltransferase
MSDMTSQPRPERAVVTASYDRGVDAYDALWSPVILPPARAVVGALRLRSGNRVVDIGAGTGALTPVLRAEVGSAARVVALDASRGMLHAARSVHGVSAAQADAAALPIADGSADAALLAFVLFHLNDPARGIAEAARVLRPGGRVGTVTWAREGSFKAGAVSDSVFADSGVPTLPVHRVDAGLDSPTGVEALLLGGRLRPERTWTEQSHHRWEPSTFWQLATGSGVNRTRLTFVDASTRRAVLTRLRKRLDELEADDYVWSGEVVCAVGTKPA